VDGRTPVDSSSLFLGDVVRVGRSCEVDGKVSKARGFVQWDRGTRVPTPMNVVAYGEAASLCIRRIGDEGFDYRPATLVRVAHDPRMITGFGLITAWFSLFAMIRSVLRQAPVDPATFAFMRFSSRVRKWMASRRKSEPS